MVFDFGMTEVISIARDFEVGVGGTREVTSTANEEELLSTGPRSCVGEISEPDAFFMDI